jgi:prevent-host-death family protein
MTKPLTPEEQLKRLRAREAEHLEIMKKVFDKEDPVTDEETIGVRDLKNSLSRVLKRVEEGVRFTVTDRGHPIAMLGPVLPRPQDEWIYRMVAEGSASWGGGGKPVKDRPPLKLKHMGGKSIVDAVLEDRGRTPEEMAWRP